MPSETLQDPAVPVAAAAPAAEPVPSSVSPVTAATGAAGATVFSVLIAISAAHFLNDVIQALLPSIYPILEKSYQLSYKQLGFITFTFQVTASLLQPVVGLYTDKNPKPYSLAVGMAVTLAGLIFLSQAGTYPMILVSAAMIGIGSSVFHPEASRIAHMAAGRQKGLAQSLFQVGGNAGSSAGPLLAALIIVPHGQKSVALFSLLALIGVIVLWRLGTWQKQHRRSIIKPAAAKTGAGGSASGASAVTVAEAAVAVSPPLPVRQVVMSLSILAALIFSKYFYMTSITSYYTFYLMERFQVSVRSSQFYLFLFLFAVAAGTILGGPVGDRIGRKRVIWGSILRVAPFTLLLPHVGLGMTAMLSVIIGLVLASAFSAILVYAQELVPGKVGMIAGLFFGFAFGMAGIGSALLGSLADHIGIQKVFNICAWLPLMGILTVFLPEMKQKPKAASA
ncbi:MAG: fosmidomycin resistance protein [Verrucomicrobiales bacterium]|nr:fosmidomycin resistance protein [Verrucomicrobiales bacterium]